MKRNVWLLSVALLAVAAIEFGVLGASSAGASFVPSWLGAPKNVPSAERQDKAPCHGSACKATPVSPPSCQPDREHGNNRACDQQPASIQLTPDPLAIHCDGVEHSTLTVRVTDKRDQPVPDGTTVYFSASNGTTTPFSARTDKGVAKTSVVFYSDLFTNGPNLFVDVGPLEAGVRIRCFPNSDQHPPCPLSPPSSPPCSPPPPQPCSILPSPPSGSPPCPTPPPSPTPFPTATPSLGGMISFGTPAIASGKLTVPILTTAAVDPFAGFNIDLAFDASVASPAGTSAGNVLQSLGSGMFCSQRPFPANLTWACTILDGGSTTSGGELAVAMFALKASTGCARFHIVTYGPPDGGNVLTGSFTVRAGTSTVDPAPQHNTYGADMTVNLADGSVGCSAPPLSPTPTETPIPLKVLPTVTPTPTPA